MIPSDWITWRKETMAQAHIKTFPIDIEEICLRLEAGEETYKVANDTGETPSMLGHYFRAYTGKKLSDVRQRMRGKQRKLDVDAG
jgi:hypothetical protein